MQTTTASGTRFTFPVRSETASNTQDRVGGSQIEATRSCDTLPPLYASRELVDVPTSHPTHTIGSGKSNPRLDDASTEPPSQVDAGLLYAHPERENVLRNTGMNSSQEPVKDLEIALPTRRPPGSAVQIHPSKSDLTRPSGDAIVDSVVQIPSIKSDLTLPPEYAEVAQENGDHEGNVAILQELAPYRMAVMGLRSEAQQQGKELRRLHQQFIDETSAIVDALETRTTGDVGAESSWLLVQVAGLSSLRLSVETARKRFHQSQEQLLSKEWKLKEEEGRLYNRYTGKQAASILSDELSDNHSDLPSISPSVSLDEQSIAPEDLDRSAASIQIGDHVESVELRLPSQAQDHLTRAFPSAPALLSLDVVTSVGPPVNFGLINESSLGHADSGQMSLALGLLRDNGVSSSSIDGRITQSSAPPKSIFLTRLGSQFDPQIQSSTHLDQPRNVELISDNSSASDYRLPKLSRWFAFGVPWSSFTRGRRHRPCRLPDGVSPWQAMTINHYGAAALGVPISGQLDLLLDNDAQESATRRSLLQSWFWDPKTRSDHASASDGEPEKAVSEVTSARKTPVAATMPRLGGSLSPTVLLENGGNSFAIADGKSRVTAASHRA